VSARQQALLPRANPTGFRLVAWRALPNSTTSLIGHATVEMPSGLTITDVPVFLRDSGTLSVGLPSRALVDGEGHQLRDADGKRRYAPSINFATPAARTRWSTAIVALLEAEGISAGA
jgi:hypothetical protein